MNYLAVGSTLLLLTASPALAQRQPAPPGAPAGGKPLPARTTPASPSPAKLPTTNDGRLTNKPFNGPAQPQDAPAPSHEKRKRR